MLVWISFQTVFHVTNAVLAWLCDAGRTPEGGLGLNSASLVSQGLPEACADFLDVLSSDPRRPGHTMSDIYHIQDIFKNSYGLPDDEETQAKLTQILAEVMN